MTSSNPKAHEPVDDGYFAKKQIFSRDRLIAWSHKSRFAMGLEFASQCVGGRVLDYGCGDGTFLAFAMGALERPAVAVGAELEEPVVKENSRRFAETDGLRFVTIDQLDSQEHERAYDAVFCMEVLEHVVDVEPVLDQLARLVAPGGRLFVSVPIETGVPLIFKQAYRTFAGWRGIGDYPGIAPYTTGELIAGLFAGRRQHIPRPVHTSAEGFASYDHKGFNWRTMRDLLAQRFSLERTVASPIRLLTPHLASQVWFQLRKA